MEHWPSKAAIAGIVAGVSAYEIMCPPDEYISDEVARIRSHRFGNVAVHALCWSVAAHLTGVMPEQYDWLHQITRLKRRATD